MRTRTSMAVAAAAQHTLAVAETGKLFAFGSGTYHQLGTGDTASRLTPARVAGLPLPSIRVRQVAAGSSHTGIVTETGDLFMCGSGINGRLGLGDERNWPKPTPVGRALFGGQTVLMVACGVSHTAVVTLGGAVYTFGSGYEGRLGHGDEEHQLAPRRVPVVAFRPDGSPDEGGEQIVMVAAGGGHTVALSEAGHVFTWGNNEYGQLGHNDWERQRAPRQVKPVWFGGQDEKVVFVAAGGTHTLAVTEAGRLYTWGNGLDGRLGHGDTGHRLVPTLIKGFDVKVVMAACGDRHTLVLTEDGATWACGSGSFGQLGLNDTERRHVFEQVQAFGGARVVAVAAGHAHSAAVTKDGTLWTWGYGASGNLGHGDKETLPIPTRVTMPPPDHVRVGRLLPCPWITRSRLPWAASGVLVRRQI